MSAVDAVFNDYLRTCDVCGEPCSSAQITVRDNIAICFRHKGFRTARELDRLNAKQKPILVRPVRGYRPLAPRPTYLAEEKQIFDLVTSVAPFETRDVSSDGAGGVTGLRSYQATGWAIVYLLSIVSEGKRPQAWRTQALASARALGDFLISKQYGNGIGPTATKSNSRVFGGFDLAQLGDVTVIASADQGIACAALCRLWQVTADEKYRYAASLTANIIVNLMATDLLASGGTTVFYGPPVHTMDSASGSFDLFFYPGDLTCLWGLTLLKTIAGDGTYGADTTISGVYAAPPQRLLSTAIAQIRSFWATGALGVNGFSSASPKSFFLATGSGSWNTGSITTSDWAAGIRSLFEVEGLSSQVTDCYGYSQSLTATPAFTTPAGTSTKQLLLSQSGDFSTSVAPPTLISPSTGKNGSSFYDFGSAGLLAPVLAAKNMANLQALKETIAVPRRRYADGAPHDGRYDYLGRLGRSGLSFQPWTAGGQRKESVTRAAQVGFLYRFGQAYGGNE